MITTNDAELAEKSKLLRGHGSKPKYYHKIVGGNFRLDAIQAAVLRVKLKYLDSWTEARQRNADTYRELFAAAGLSIEPGTIGCLQENCKSHQGNCSLTKGFVLPQTLSDRRHIYNQFVIRTNRRDELIAHLKNQKIGNEIYYPVPMHQQECFADFGYSLEPFEVSECAALRTVALPIYPELSTQQIAAVADVINGFARGQLT